MLWFYIHNEKTKFIVFIYIIYIIYNKYNIYTQCKCSVRKMEGSQSLSYNKGSVIEISVINNYFQKYE